MIREKVWQNMIIAKFKAIYLSYFNSSLRSTKRLIKGIVIIASSGGVSSWIIWQDFPFIWATVIGLAELIQLLKPLFPFFKDHDDLARTYFFYEELSFSYEKIWSMIEADVDKVIILNQYHELREKELSHLKLIKHLKLPDYSVIRKRAETDWKIYLNNQYNITLDE